MRLCKGLPGGDECNKGGLALHICACSILLVKFFCSVGQALGSKLDSILLRVMARSRFDISGSVSGVCFVLLG